jgi:hypothetical protein
MCDRTLKESYLTDVVIPNSQNLYIISTEKLQTGIDPKEELTKIRQLNTVDIVPLILSTKSIP